MPPRHFAHWPPGVPHEPRLPEVSVYRNLEASAARRPDKPLLKAVSPSGGRPTTCLAKIGGR